jgi:chromosome segregation ATPase
MSWQDRTLELLRVRDDMEQHDKRYLDAFNELLVRVAARERAGDAASEDAPTALKEVTTRANALAFAEAAANAKVAALERAEAHNQRLVNLLRQRLDDAKAQLRDKDKSIELINDEVLSAQIQNNVLAARCRDADATNARLRAENDALVLRWIAKVAADAERINDQNERLARP